MLLPGGEWLTYTPQGYFEGNISIVVRNTDQLYFVIQTLQNMDGINSVTASMSSNK